MHRCYSFLFLSLVLSLALAAAAPAVVLNYTADIDGLQEVPPNASPAVGSATITIDTDANTLSYNITFAGLTGTETAAHIHGFADPGINAGALHTLPAGSPKVGVWNYAEADEANILAGLCYINIHSTLFGGGEIRGQIVEESVDVEPTTWSRIKRLVP